MDNKLEKKINSIKGTLLSFDPSSQDDPIARKTSWNSVKPLECMFRAHQAKIITVNRLEFCATKSAKLFYLVFFFAGSGVIINIIYNIFLSGGLITNSDTLILLLVGLVFASVGGGMYYYGTEPIVFSKSNGFFWKGRKSSSELNDCTNKYKNITKIKQIYALQIIPKYCRGKDSSHRGYELNIVLNNAERINIVSHTNLVELRKDGATLADFLGKIIWDAGEKKG